MKRAIFLSICSVALLIFSQIEVVACGCPGSKDTDITMAVTQHFGNASIVFSGEVIAKEFVPIIKEDTSGKAIKAENLVYKFLVGGWWKGKFKDEITLNTSHFRYPDLGYGENSGCEYSFEVGEKYLVYAVGSKGKFIAHSCSGTTRIENAEKDIQQLQKLKAENEEFVIKSLINDPF